MLVSSFTLSQSYNYTPYLFYKKWFKSGINSFCVWTQWAKATVITLLRTFYAVSGVLFCVLQNIDG